MSPNTDTVPVYAIFMTNQHAPPRSPQFGQYCDDPGLGGSNAARTAFYHNANRPKRHMNKVGDLIRYSTIYR